MVKVRNKFNTERSLISHLKLAKIYTYFKDINTLTILSRKCNQLLLTVVELFLNMKSNSSCSKHDFITFKTMVFTGNHSVNVNECFNHIQNSRFLKTHGRLFLFWYCFHSLHIKGNRNCYQKPYIRVDLPITE